MSFLRQNDRYMLLQSREGEQGRRPYVGKPAPELDTTQGKGKLHGFYGNGFHFEEIVLSNGPREHREKQPAQ